VSPKKEGGFKFFFMYAIYKFIRMIQVSLWFYFFPYTVLFGSFLVPFTNQSSLSPESEIADTRLLMDNFVVKCPVGCTEQWMDDTRMCFCLDNNQVNTETNLAKLKAEQAILRAEAATAAAEIVDLRVKSAESEAKINAMQA
jgi:hypothetical protein